MTRDTSMISTENSPSRSVELRFDPLKNRPTFGVRSAARLFPSRPFAFAAINGLPPLLSHPLRNNGSRNSNSCLNRKNLHTCSLSSLLFSSLLSSSIPFYSIPFHSILLSSHRRRMPECHRWPIFDRFFSHFQPQRQPQVGRLVIRFDLRPSSYLRHLDPGSAFSYLICVFVRGESRKMPAAVLAMQLFSSSSSSLSLSLSLLRSICLNCANDRNRSARLQKQIAEETIERSDVCLRIESHQFYATALVAALCA